VRADVCGKLAFLGVAVDGAGPVSVHVIEAREDLVAAREARRTVA
jgi:hypothetical protein